VAAVVLVIITLIILYNMAVCSNCKANVGCGCQLTNGLCYSCDGQKKKEAKKITIEDNNKNNKDAIPKAR
jgi:positive regulator of sigma E activity